MNTSELFGTLKELSEKAKLDPALEVSVSVNLTGADPAWWNARAGGGQLRLEEGELPEADVSVTASSETAIGIFEKTVDPMMAFLTGKIKLKGDIGKIAMLKGLISKKK
jgi:putative sterol carrier protein